MSPRNPIILCVDDEAANLKLLEKLLVPHGYEVASASNGIDALAKIRTLAIDLVLLDIMMPGMDGFEVCRQIKEDQKLRNIPVIMITALSAKQDRIRGIEAGAEEFLSKPFDQTETLARIKILLRLKELDADRQRAEAALQKSHDELENKVQERTAELTLAYDATIEGWSRALELRDKETEGHSRRVTEMTVRLARAFGISEEELVQVRWGALLHDIGKMGIPDGILLKPGPLTTDEWALMKRHPAIAYEMLAPVRYLRLALDIPYRHHEKWDGTGYPLGLRGEQIPLTARIFAVVDVWDAMRSDRPYRAAWPEEKAREQIRSLAGTHFDPKVAEMFLKLDSGRDLLK